MLDQHNLVGTLDNLDGHYLSFKNSTHGRIILSCNFNTTTVGRNIWKLRVLVCSETLNNHSFFNRPRKFSFVTAKVGSESLVFGSQCKPTGGSRFLSNL